MQPQVQAQSQAIRQLRQWIQESGILMHPGVQIPMYFDGIQGVGTRQLLEHKTVFMAIPSSKIITVTRCYNDAELKGLFRSSDEHFDYEVDEQAQFKVLCVFLMYHKLHLDTSPWKAYIKTMAMPETAVDWSDSQLVGLNKSLIEQILHIRRECKKVEKQLCGFLRKTKQFGHLTLAEIEVLFKVCYKSVLTRCFGYYFSTACMIPVADLLNHHCNSVDHQLIHVGFQQQKGFDVTYKQKRNKLNCQLLGLPKPKKDIKMPYPLRYITDENIIEKTQKQKLSHLSISDIKKSYDNFLEEKRHQDPQTQRNMLEFQYCELDDREDNDTDEDAEEKHAYFLESMKEEERKMIQVYQKNVLKVENYEDVEKQVYEQFPEAKQEDQAQFQREEAKMKQKEKEYLQNQQISMKLYQSTTKTNQSSKSQEVVQNQPQGLNNKVEVSSQKEAQSEQTPQMPNSKVNSTQNQQSASKNTHQSKPQQDSSESEDSLSQEQTWNLDPQCYFTLSTSAPVAPGSELFNSYGSRTNKFLLVWYGFAYRDNLYDSVTLRMHSIFSEKLPAAKEIVLDTYIGGQGICFRKNESEIVKPNQVSKQFRLKRSCLCSQLIMFLRLYLVYFYREDDQYKIFVSIPSSFTFQLFMMGYYLEIVESIYDRYPIESIQHLKQEHSKQIDHSAKKKIQFKIIYLEEQRKILDTNVQALQSAIKLLQKLKQQSQEGQASQFQTTIYAGIPTQQLRLIKDYLKEIKDNYKYIVSLKSIKQEIKAQQSGNKEREESDGQWEDQSNDQS